MSSKPEAFTAAEAAELFQSYYTTGDFPSKYRLRPIEAYDADGAYLPGTCRAKEQVIRTPRRVRIEDAVDGDQFQTDAVSDR
jgi:hypothetical protein